ncbi:FMN-dependent dehydrogenase [Hirsutella rhossiliensis]|uniref:FMN-dependent dehydrogenase domain-containing protein n=1 Tax=Hirsutella rhossiliensis TaxID=111463 RepID=A0A9P8MYV0_9HYPO|nr:FMN-dependent dehydrogenase domain-containing protein [Hirsutella rhossiliensis]KAH0962801.1 FMN-dependent dehydrogenase domain-containing protein [Hirsutella rhossiliensis]
MRTQILFSALANTALAARPFLNEPDTGFDDALSNLTAGSLPNVEQMVSLPDFDAVARKYLPIRNYTYYRNGAAGEWSYRNNLEVFRRYRLRPRVLRDISNIESTLPTKILGHNFSAPFYISPCARGELGHPEAELNFVKAAAEENILYMPALYASKTIDEIAAAKSSDQVLFQQLYLSSNDTENQALLDATKKANAAAVVFTVDSAADGNRHRAARFDVGSADSDYSSFTWDFYKKLKTMTDLPIILKGIMTVEDARIAVQNNVSGIILSNHGGRQLDGAPSSLEVALEINQQDPSIFSETEVFADGGVRYGADVLMLLSLGVKAVGLGRPFMYANIFGKPGVKRAISLLKREIALDAGNLGVADLQQLTNNIVDWTPNNWVG